MAPWTFQGLQEGVVSACQGIAVTVQNPTLRRHKFLKIFIYLSIISFILLGLANVLISIPIQIVRSILWLSSSDKAMHADDALNSISKLIRELISSVPFMVLLFMRYVYPRPLNELFMESLRYLDKTHPDRAPYCAPLLLQKTKKTYWKDMKDYVVRSWKKLRIGMLLLLLSFIPVIGRFVFPLAGRFISKTCPDFFWGGERKEPCDLNKIHKKNRCLHLL
jgi:hypothetical protein